MDNVSSFRNFALAAFATLLLSSCASPPLAVSPPADPERYFDKAPGTTGIPGAGILFGSVRQPAMHGYAATLVFMREGDEEFGSIQLPAPGVLDRLNWTTDGEMLVRPFQVAMHFGRYRFIGYYPDVRTVNANTPPGSDFVAFDPPLMVKLYPAMAAYMGQWTPQAAADGDQRRRSFTLADRLKLDRDMVRPELARLPKNGLIENFVPHLFNRANPMVVRKETKARPAGPGQAEPR